MIDSDDLQQGVTKAVEEVAAGNGLVTGWIMLVEYIDDEGDPCWVKTSHPDQHVGADLGQATFLQVMADHQVRDHLEDD